MMILCPHCATSYRVEPSSLGKAGRSVRCVRCRTVWFATPERARAVSAAHQHTEKLASELATAALGLATAPEAPPPPSAAGRDSLAEPQALSEPGDDLPAAAEPQSDPLSEMSATPPAAAVEEMDATQPDEPAQIDQAPSIIPPIVEQLANLPTTLPDPHQIDDDIESFAARRERLRARRRKSSRFLRPPSLPVVILALVAVVATLIGWRKSVVHHAPQTASLYAAIGLPVNVRGLVFDTIKTTRETQDGIPVLVVEGTIGSRSTSQVDVPRLRFAVRNAAGVELYSWTAMPSRPVVGPGEQLAFRSRLASPPAEAQEVTVRFFNRHDAVAGMR